MKHICRVLCALAFTALGACAPSSNLIAERIRSEAPKGPNETGVLIQGAKPEDVSRILSVQPQAQVRALDGQTGLYEIFNVPLAQIQKSYSGLVEPNRWLEAEPVQAAAQRVPFGLQVGSLQKCRPSRRLPNPVLQVVSPNNLRDYVTLDLGAEIVASAVDGGSSEGPIKINFVVIAPKFSNLQDHVEVTPSIRFTPDMAGSYALIAVAQDSNRACAMDVLHFVITAHPAYRGPKPFHSATDLAPFTHLKQISAEGAWKINQGAGQVVAFIDSGVDYNSPFLSDQILLNEKEIPNNGIDDDGNGYVDDYVGYDLINHNPLPYDDDGHGTHTAALAMGHAFGVAQQAKIIPIKALSPIGGDVGSISAAIRYAVDRGATIINLSVGADVKAPPQILRQALDYALNKNVLVVAAAGNGDPLTGLGFNIDNEPVYPASLHTPNMITVGAFDEDTPLSVYSNFGPKTVDVTAPGGSPAKPIFSAAPENPQGQMFAPKNGTSMATPLVSGIAALVRSHAPALTLPQIRGVLLNAGPHVTDIENIIVSGRHIDALRALELSTKPNALY